ncbi:MFS transporter [Candidatus Peregrinibacteria bacterium]|jgi:MFS transporter, DHA1 family, tetracycline resistance protein|nr:MFS transporter [Candidatus Peregrinibacteria bacterium]MBT4632228.1 MFS transporter [Candidatus Peregrinibacteria bacterium]MBT5516671.1 MFS transporter [Candidatus Peregrinibacteria bacterium]MBT5824361.1 MFS transporter [Candidatus Peregrinibacteria bacterium]
MNIKKKTGLSILFFVVFLDLLGVGIAIPVLAPLFLESNVIIPAAWSESMRTISLGVLIGAYPLAQFIGAPILGNLSDRYGRKPVLKFSLFGTLIGYLLFALGIITNQLWLLFFSRILDGFTGGNIAVANSAIADLSPTDKDKAKNFGLIGAAFGVGFVIGPFIGGIFSDSSVISWFSPALPFFIMAFLGALNLILLELEFKETLKESKKTKISLLSGFENIKKAFKYKKLRIMFLVTFLHALGFTFFTHFFPVYLIQKYAFSNSELGLFYGYIGIWIALGHGVIARVAANYFKSETTLRFAPFLLSLSLVLLVVPEHVGWLFFSQALVASFEGLTFPNVTTVISKLSSPEKQGEVLGITQSLRALAEGITPIISGFIVIAGPSVPTLTAAAIIFVAWLVFITSFKVKS